MQHWKTISLTNGWAWTELHSPVSRSQPHYSSKEVQLWRGLQNADRLARGKLAGKVGTGATLQTPAELQGSSERSHLCHCLSSCEVALQPHLSHSHTEWPHPISHPKLSCTLVRSRCTQTTQWEHHITESAAVEGKNWSPAHVATRTAQDC